MPENEYKYLDHAGLTRFKGKIQDILDTKVDKEDRNFIQITTDLKTYIDNSTLPQMYLWSTSSDSTTVGAPNDHGFYYLVNKVNSSTAFVIAVQFASSSRNDYAEYILEKYANTWRDWVKIPAQTEFDTLNTNSYQYKGVLTSSDDLNNVTTRGFYAITTRPTNSPIAYNSLIVTVSGATVYQTLLSPEHIYTRAYTGNPMVWTDWVKHPTRAEFDQLSNKVGKLVTSGSFTDITDSGLYYVGNDVTGKPEGYNNGGVYVLAKPNNTTSVGIFVQNTGGNTNNAWYRAEVNGSAQWHKINYKDEIDSLLTPTAVSSVSSANYDGTYIDKSATNNCKLNITKMGKLVTIRGEFIALAEIPNSATKIASGLPHCFNGDVNGTFLAINCSTRTPVLLCVDANGYLKMYYGGAIAAGNIVRFSGTYFTV